MIYIISSVFLLFILQGPMMYKYMLCYERFVSNIIFVF